MSSIWLDLRYSLRRLRKSPGTVAIAVLTLAVGMSGPTSVYTMMDAWIFEPLPFAGSSRLLDLRAADKKDGGLVALSAPELAEWTREARTLEDLAGDSVEDIRLTGEGRPERLAGGRVTANFFALLRARPALGRLFQTGDGRPGENRVIILSHGLWRDRFVGDPAIVGKTILADDEPHTVVGVLPADFHFTLMGRVNIWTPLAFTPAEEANRGRRGFFAVARLRDGSETAEAAAEIKQIASRAAAAHPATDSGSEPRVQRLTDEVRRHHDFGILPSVFAMALCIFLVACANVANIVLARAAARQREMAVRVALGASRLRVIRQWMLENGIIFAAATAIAAAVTPFVTDAITNAIPWENRGYLRNYGVLAVSGNVLFFAASNCLLASLGFGLLPAVAGVRTGIQDSLREGSGKASPGKRDNRLRGFLVAAQFALALCLMSGAAMLTINARNLVQKDPGFQTRGLVTFAVSPSEKQYASNARTLEFLDRARNTLAAQPGVEAAAFASWAPFTSSGGYATFWIQGRAEPAPQDLP